MYVDSQYTIMPFETMVSSECKYHDVDIGFEIFSAVDQLYCHSPLQTSASFYYQLLLHRCKLTRLEGVPASRHHSLI